MSVYKRPGQTVYSYDFRLNGDRYSGTTGATQKRKAEEFEAEQKKRLTALVEKAGAPLTVGVAFGRFWDEVGQHLTNSETMLVNLNWIEKELGKPRLISTIGPEDVARLIAKRRAEKSKVGKEKKALSAATINRGVIAPLRAVLTRAARKWRISVEPIDWGDFALKEPQERVRELKAEEEVQLFATLRPDYHPIVRFALLTGCRREECVGLRWADIDWGNGQLRVTGKGRKTRTIPVSNGVRALLWPLPRAHAQVFVYQVKRPDLFGDDERSRKGTLQPINAEGLKSIFERAVARAQIENFHFHDLRHTCATRLLRATGNLRVVKDLLGHTDIKTTLRYAHVSTEDLRGAMHAAETATKITTDEQAAGGKALTRNAE